MLDLKNCKAYQKVPRAKTVYFQSKFEIPKILEFVGAMESLDKFNSFNLGYQEVVTQ